MLTLKGPQYDIVSFARRHREVTRPVLASRLGLSLPTVSLSVRSLIKDKLLLKEGLLESSGGRRAEILRINPDFMDGIGLRVSMAGVIGVVADLGGNVVAKSRLDWRGDPSKDDILNALYQATSELLKSGRRKPVGVGVGITGLVSQADGVSLRFPYVEDWKDMPVRSLLEQRFNLPVSMDNDVKASTLAELRFGEGRTAENFLYVFVGKGIGLGIVLDGKVYHGASGNAGELGHLAVKADGSLCHCGNYGCLETLAGPPAIVHQVKEAIARGASSSACPEPGAAVTIERVLAAAENGDRLAGNVVEKAAEHIGLALANMANLLDPQMIVLGGLLSTAPKNLIDTIKRVFDSRVLPSIAPTVELKVSSLGDMSGALGAADMVFENHIRSLRTE